LDIARPQIQTPVPQKINSTWTITYVVDEKLVPFSLVLAFTNFFIFYHLTLLARMALVICPVQF
jgi:hypothetical protein